MTSHAWFFSTVSQSVAAVVGFTITLLTVLHQLEYNRRKERTDDLRDHMIEFKQKYSSSLNQVMEILKEPFAGEVPCELPEAKNLSLDDIESISEDSSKDPVTSNQVWAYCYYMSYIINQISPSENPREDYLISEGKIQELQQCLEGISGNIMENGDTVRDEIELYSDDIDKLSLRQEIVPDLDSKYIDLQDWFSQHFEEHEDRHQLEGSNILSLVNYFNEMEQDVARVRAKSQDTALDSPNNLSELLPYLAAFALVGIFIPIASLITLPNDIVILSGWLLTIYESVVLIVSTTLLIILLMKMRSWLPLKY